MGSVISLFGRLDTRRASPEPRSVRHRRQAVDRAFPRKPERVATQIRMRGRQSQLSVNWGAFALGAAGGVILFSVSGITVLLESNTATIIDSRSSLIGVSPSGRYQVSRGGRSRRPASTSSSSKSQANRPG